MDPFVNPLTRSGRVVSFNEQLGIGYVKPNPTESLLVSPGFELAISHRYHQVPVLSLTREYVELIDRREFDSDDRPDLNGVNIKPVIKPLAVGDFVLFEAGIMLDTVPVIRQWAYRQDVEHIRTLLAKPKTYGFFVDGEEVFRGNRLEFSALLPRQKGCHAFDALKWDRWQNGKRDIRVLRTAHSGREIWKHAGDDRASYCCLSRPVIEHILSTRVSDDDLRSYLFRQHGLRRSRFQDDCQHKRTLVHA